MRLLSYFQRNIVLTDNNNTPHDLIVVYFLISFEYTHESCRANAKAIREVKKKRIYSTKEVDKEDELLTIFIS